MAGEILVVVEHQAGRLTRAAWEAVAAAQHMAQELGAGVVAAVLGEQVSALASELATADLTDVFGVSSPLLAEYSAEAYTTALHCVITELQPKYAVFTHTYQARDFVPKLAARLRRPLVSDCLGYRRADGRLIFLRYTFQGKFVAEIEVEGDPPHLVAFQPAAFRADSARKGSQAARMTDFPAPLSRDCIRTRPGQPFRQDKGATDLSQAEVIVAVGRGIKAQENLELARKLADLLDAELGASRPVCDNAWLPMDRQIGSSGQTVAPKLYVALGISGAIQHQTGMRGSRTVVAINKDKEAPIFDVATYGIVGDLFEIVPPLIEELKKAKAG